MNGDMQCTSDAFLYGEVMMACNYLLLILVKSITTFTTTPYISSTCKHSFGVQLKPRQSYLSGHSIPFLCQCSINCLISRQRKGFKRVKNQTLFCSPWSWECARKYLFIVKQAKTLLCLTFRWSSCLSPTSTSSPPQTYIITMTTIIISSPLPPPIPPPM